MVSSKVSSKSRSPSRTVKRGKSKSQKDADSKDRSRGRRPPSRNPSNSESLKQTKRPDRRGRSGTPNLSREPRRKAPNRTRSVGLEHALGPTRQNAPTTRKARSMSPSIRIRNTSSSGNVRSRSTTRGRSVDQASRSRSRSRARSFDRFSDEGSRKEYPSQKPEDNGISLRRIKDFRRSFIGVKDVGISWFQVIQYIIPLLVIIGSSVGLVFATGNGSIITDKIDVLIRTIDKSDLIDPNSGRDAPHWPANGNGLRVTIINALSDDWQTTFGLAKADWNFGMPDAVEITEEKGVYDSNCEAPDEKIIVCNGDYGDSKWRGVNEAMLDPRGNVISSSARMNEFYLFNMPSGAWQYTMCHEIGHTLGLGHTDEDFENEDLGNCMDYTDNLDANKHPDTSNYETLLSIYGPIARRQRLRQRQLRKSGSRTDGEASFDPSPKLSIKRLRRKGLQRIDSHLKDNYATKVETVTAGRAVPDHIRHKKKEAVQKLLKRIESNHSNDHSQKYLEGHTHKDGWKLVHRRLHGEEHETELGEGYKVRVQLFLVH